MGDPLDDICGRINEDLDMARALQNRGAILEGERPIDKAYTHLYIDTVNYFKSLPLNNKIPLINLFLKRYSKKD